MKQLRLFTWLQLIAAFLLAIIPLELSQQIDPFTGAPIDPTTPLRSVFFGLSMALVCVIVGTGVVVISKLKHVQLTWPMFVLLAVFVARHIAGILILQQHPASMRAMTINMMATTVPMLACVVVAAVLAARHFKASRTQKVNHERCD